MRNIRHIIVSHIIVSNNPATIEYIRETLPEFANAPVTETAHRRNVAGMVVCGNLPLHLAVLAKEMVAIEFKGNPPLGNEYGHDELEDAGVYLRRYKVQVLN